MPTLLTENRHKTRGKREGGFQVCNEVFLRLSARLSWFQAIALVFEIFVSSCKWDSGWFATTEIFNWSHVSQANIVDASKGECNLHGRLKLLEVDFFKSLAYLQIARHRAFPDLKHWQQCSLCTLTFYVTILSLFEVERCQLLVSEGILLWARVVLRRYVPRSTQY